MSTRDEHPRLTAECRHCGLHFDTTVRTDCPRCRAEAVKQAFKPVDMLRTALGVGLTPDAELDGVWHWHGAPYKPRVAPEDTPRECKMPKSAEDQVYQLRRLYRL